MEKDPDSSSEGEAEIAVPLLTAPRTPLPEVITTVSELERAYDQLRAGHGDIALDAERASGYKYSQRAYLVQIFRRGGGLHLIDPIALFTNNNSKTGALLFSSLNEILEGAAAVIHASSQDLPCLREIGIEPRKLFDTELAGRIAGFPRVGLGALTESLLNIRLAKEHSAVDWSQRPLHHDWLIYAALDVDVLLDLKDEIVRVLKERAKLEWALEESAAALHAEPPPPRREPWRRTSGMHQVKKPEQLAIVRELWQARDQLARERDIAAGRLLNDRAIVSAALRPPTSISQCRSIPAFKREAERWWRAIEAARANPTVAKPPPSDGPPTHIRIWRERAPIAYARLTHARGVLSDCAQSLELPVENLLSPDLVRRFCWQDPPPGGRSEGEVAQFLRGHGARGWQVALTAARLLAIEGETTPLSAPEPDEPPDSGGISEVSDLS